MKSKFITSFVMGLLLVGSAYGDAGNSDYIDQTNADNSSVSITQSGSDNKVGDPNSLTTPQFAIDGNNMNLTILQDGMGNAITGNFVGGDSTANINQTGNSNTTNLLYGSLGSNGGTLGIAINGSNNATSLTIGTTGDASNYNYSLNIAGANGGSANGNAVTRVIGAMVDLTESLEKMNTIEQQNKTLKDISWTQSHVVRAPLANLLGLINLLKDNKKMGYTDERLIDYIGESATKLDHIIHEIVKKSSRNDLN